MVEAKKKQQPEPSQWWWFERLSAAEGNQKRSPWLQSTLSELDEKTGAMLKLIEEDADSFAKRAEMYYKKRPQLISLVEEFYRTHRSLAERYDLHRPESGPPRLLTKPWESPLPVTKCSKPKSSSNSNSSKKSYDSCSDTETYDASPFSVSKCGKKTYDSYSETYESEEEYEESDVEDPEPEQVKDDVAMKKILEEMERLKEELVQKDEEKRDVIRQLSLAMDLLREENQELRKRLVTEKQNHQSAESNAFWKRLFGKSSA